MKTKTLVLTAMLILVPLSIALPTATADDQGDCRFIWVGGQADRLCESAIGSAHTTGCWAAGWHCIN